MSFAIALANHENNRENYRGFDVPDLPESKYIVQGGSFDLSKPEDKSITCSCCFGSSDEQEAPKLLLVPSCSKTLYRNLEEHGRLR